MLPHIELPIAAEGSATALRSIHGETTVIYWMHSFECVECDQYLQALTSIVDEFRVWDARLLVCISPEIAAAPSPLPFGTLLINDQFPLEGTGLIVADRYGQVFYVVRAHDGHTLPSAQELTEWLKHLGTLCPE
jgi:hypothetical protein